MRGGREGGREGGRLGGVREPVFRYFSRSVTRPWLSGECDESVTCLPFRLFSHGKTAPDPNRRLEHMCDSVLCRGRGGWGGCGGGFFREGCGNDTAEQ